MLVRYRQQNDSLYSDFNSRIEDLSSSGIKSLQNIGDSNAPGAVVHAFYAGHLYANTFDQEDTDNSDDIKLEYPVIQYAIDFNTIFSNITDN